MVSPLNSFVGLTRTGPGAPAELLASLYPTGRRNYLRVFPTDDLQGAALALLARDRGRRRVYVLDDGQPGYGVLMATGFATAARRLGLRDRARELGPARALLRGAGGPRRGGAPAAPSSSAGCSTPTRRASSAPCARRLGPGVDLLGPDGLTPLPLLVRKAGGAARGVFVSLAGVVTERLPRGGAAFVQRFAPTQAGAPRGARRRCTPRRRRRSARRARALGRHARLGARRAVRTRVRDGLLGDFEFDARGDITESPVTILRVARGGSPTGSRASRAAWWSASHGHPRGSSPSAAAEPAQTSSSVTASCPTSRNSV